MSEPLQIRVLGPLAVASGADQLELGGRRQRRLLMGLVVDAGSTISSDRLIERVWGDTELPADPSATLRTYLTRLRQALGRDQVIVTEPSGWRLDDSAIEIDAVRFVELVEHASEAGVDVHRRMGLFDEALGLWRGDALEEVAEEEWARAEADRLTELRVTAIERRFEAMLAAGMHTDALPGLVGEVEVHPFRDRLVGLQMLALFRSGRQAEATRVFQAHRDRLADELGLQPGRELAELDGRIVAADLSLLLDETPGRPLRGYRLGEQLGEGAFAVVFRGTQPSVGRDVAVKVIRAELANRPEFVRQFEAEAHLVARLEHPYIVPLYDYWREPDRACLVFRYLRGGTLEQRLSSSGGLSVDECRMFVDEVGAALSAAHQAGVVHRDVKPANVFLDDAGNFYLGDFGIALEAAELSDPTASLSAGSPAYASPEQLRREPIGPSADVHGLGVSIYEALTGRLPFPAAISQADLLQRQLHDPIPAVREWRADVSAGVDEVLARATAKDPADRFQTVGELVAEFKAVVDDGPAPVRTGALTRVSTLEVKNPYKGLEAFTEADSADFYGRERLVDRLVETLALPGTQGRIAAVVGPSGIGKSSVVRAGLLPALRRGAVTGSDRWFVATMLPGRDPFEELGAALLRVATRAPDNMMSQLSDDHRGIARVVKAVAPEGDLGDVVLVIDQFEELFTLVDDDKVTRLFLDSLEHALTDARCPLRVVLTMRADFWDRPLRHGSFARLIDGSTINVTALAPDELERAIVEPAHRAGAEFEPGLVSEIVADLTDQPGALPLLQYALTELWEAQVSGLLTRDAYRELGGVAGALTRRAEAIYLEAEPEEQAVIRRIFGLLVTPGDGTADTRRRALRDELEALPGAWTTVEDFGVARLLSFDTDPSSRQPTVEVAHEALIRQWPRLRAWLDQDRDDIRVHRHLKGAALEWQNSGRSDAETYRGSRLETALEWVAVFEADLTDAERDFIEASVERQASEDRVERQRADEQLRANRRLRRLLTAVAVIAVFALVAGAVAFQQRNVANDARIAAEDAQAETQAANEEARGQTELAQERADELGSLAEDLDVRRLLAEAAVVGSDDRRLGLLLAMEAHQIAPSPDSLGAIQSLLVSAPPNWVGSISFESSLIGAWFGQDGTLLVATASTVEVWDAEGAVRQRQESVAGDLVQAALSPDGDIVVLGFRSGVWEVRSTLGWDVLADGDLQVPVSAVAIDATRVAVAGDVPAEASPEILLHSLVNQSELRVEVPTRPTELLFSPGGEMLASSGGVDPEPAVVLDTSTGQAVGPPLALGVGPVQGVGAMAWVGESLFIALSEQTALVDPTTGEVLQGPIDSPSRNFNTGRAASAQNSALIRAGTGGIEAFDKRSGELKTVVDESQIGFTRSLSVSADQQLVAVADMNSVHIYSLDGRGTLALRRIPVGAFSAELDENATTLFTWGPTFGPPATGWSLDVPGIPGEVFPLLGKSLAGDGAFWFLGGDEEIDLNGTWRDGEVFLHHGAEFITGTTYARSPTGLAIVSGSIEDVASVRVLSEETGELVTELESITADVRQQPQGRQVALDIQFSHDKELLVITSRSGRVFFYDPTDWSETRVPLEPVDGFHFIDFTSDGSRAFTYNFESGEVAVRRSEDMEIILGPVAAPLAVGLGGQSPDILAGDKYAIIGGAPGVAYVWDIEELSRVGDSFPHETDFRQPGVAADASVMATTTDGAVVLWDVDVESWPEIACRAVGRNMTAEEWARYGPGPIDEPYNTTCAQWPGLS